MFRSRSRSILCAVAGAAVFAFAAPASAEVCQDCNDGGGGGGEQTFCTREYAPVCARRHGQMRTFPNACEARAADYRIVGDGPC